MDYKAMRDRIEDIVNDNHRDFVKAIISIEKGIHIYNIDDMEQGIMKRIFI